MNDILTFAKEWAGLDRPVQDDIESILHPSTTPEELKHILLWSNGLPDAIRELRKPLRNIDTKESRDMLSKLEHAVKEITA